MPDTARSQSALLALFADNISGDISAQDARDFIVSTHNKVDGEPSLDDLGDVSVAAPVDASVLTFSTTAGVWEAQSAGGGGGTIQPSDANTYNVRASNEGATTGNARGENSVDLQTIRSLVTHVAGGANSVIGGGQRNEITTGGNGGVIGGGRDNDVTNRYSAICGGRSNLASGEYSCVGGGFNNDAEGNNSVIAGGQANTASGGYAAVAGGHDNTASDYYAFVGGGDQNTAREPYSCVGGGKLNRTLGNYAVVAGGNDNDAIGYHSFIGGGKGGVIQGDEAYSVICGGQNNAVKIQGTHGVVCGGYANYVAATHATVVGGNTNTTAAQRSFIGGGNNNSIVGLYNFGAVICGGGYNSILQTSDSDPAYASIVGGARALATKYGQQAHAAGRFTDDGDAQTSQFILRITSTDASGDEMFLDGDAGLQRLFIPQSTTWGFTGWIVGRRAGATDQSAQYEIRGLIDRDLSVATLIDSNVTAHHEDDAAWDVALSADLSNDSLRITVTGAIGSTIKWVAYLRTVEVTVA